MQDKFWEYIRIVNPTSGEAIAMIPVPVGRLLSGALLVALAGCIHVKIDESRQMPAEIAAGDTVVLLARPQLAGVNSETGFLNCLERKLLGRDVPEAVPGQPVAAVDGDHFRLLPHQTFVDSVYPWLEPSTTPVDADFVQTLLARPGIKERIAADNVRYLVSIEGSTNVVEKEGSISCAIGPGGGGCLGVAFWKKQSGYEATIWDLQRGSSMGTVGADVDGRSVFIGAIVPLPLVAPVQRTACNRLAGELQRFLLGTDVESGT
jgi:hypothetical protein